MLISVITPFKKGRAYLKDCLESLAAQSMRVFDEQETARTASALSMTEEQITNDADTFYTDAEEGENRYGLKYTTVPYRNFELVLVLDRPEEDVTDLIDEYKTKFPIKVVTVGDGVNDEEFAQRIADNDGVEATDITGVSAARNAGMDNADGDYLFFLDSDDHLFPRALSFIERSIQYGDQPDMIYGIKITSWIRREKYIEVYAKHLERMRLLNDLGHAAGSDIENSGDSEGADDTGEGSDGGDSDDESGASGAQNSSDWESDDSAALDDVLFYGTEADILDHTKEIIDLIGNGHVPEISDDASELCEIIRDTIGAEEFENYSKSKAADILIARRKGIKNISALGIAFKRTLIAGNDIRFPESQRYYADPEFLCRAIDCAHSFRKNDLCRYIKRRHDEQSSFPAIIDEVSPARFNQYVDSYVDTRDKLSNGGAAAKCLDLQFVKYFANYYTKMMVTRKSEYWRTTRFEMMQNAMTRVPADYIESLPRFMRKSAEALLAGSAEQVCKVRNSRDSRRRFANNLKRRFAWLGGGKR